MAQYKERNFIDLPGVVSYTNFLNNILNTFVQNKFKPEYRF